jgi:hypothetical protein
LLDKLVSKADKKFVELGPYSKAVFLIYFKQYRLTLAGLYNTVENKYQKIYLPQLATEV